MSAMKSSFDLSSNQMGWPPEKAIRMVFRKGCLPCRRLAIFFRLETYYCIAFSSPFIEVCENYNLTKREFVLF
jgi:hypothetical protein